MHMEYAGMVIYHKKLESGRFKLPGFDEETTSLSIHWSDLMMMVESVKLRSDKLKKKILTILKKVQEYPLRMLIMRGVFSRKNLDVLLSSIP